MVRYRESARRISCWIQTVVGEFNCAVAGSQTSDRPLARKPSQPTCPAAKPSSQQSFCRIQHRLGLEQAYTRAQWPGSWAYVHYSDINVAKACGLLTSLDQAQQGLINYKGSICLKWKFGKLTVSLSQFAHLWAWSLKTLCPIPALPKTKAFRLFVAGRWWWPSEALPVKVGGLQPDQQVETIRTEIGDFVVFLVFLQNSRRRRRRCHHWCCCSTSLLLLSW